MATLARTVGAAATHTVVVVLLLGAFSRFTHGVYTPAFYAYQLDRAPDNESTRLVPYVDSALAGLTLLRASRSYALFFAIAFQVMGLGLRLRSGKDATTDVALVLATVVALVTSVTADVKGATRETVKN